ncbi:MAG: sugar-binding protein [Verrucomicrobiota bacterium]
MTRQPHCRFLALGLLGLGLPVAAMAADEAQPGNPTVSLSADGVALACGSMGTFTLAYPQLDLGDDKKHEPVEKRVQGASATLTYAGGGSIVVAAAAGKISLTFEAMPAATKAFTAEMLIAPNYSDGGRWSVGDAAGAFPKDKPAKPHLFQGHSRSFDLANINNKRLSFALPEFTYVQIQDNREWGWNTFWVQFKVPFAPERKTCEIGIALDASAAQRVVLVDRFGQTTQRDFAGKLKAESDLKSDTASEAAYYASLTPPVRNTYGGLPGSGTQLGLKKTGFFHVEAKPSGAGERWILTDPAGDAYFHLGVCSFGPGEDYTSIEGRSEVFEWLPPHSDAQAAAWHTDSWWNPRAVSFYKANVIRKYGAYDEAAHLGRLVDRVRQVGFNSVGAFSADSPVFAAKGFPRVGFLPLNAWTLGAPVPGVRGVFDPFDAANLAKMDSLFAKEIAASAADPLLIGYFLDNEQAFEDIPRAVPALPGKHACKRELVALLQAKYQQIAAFNTAWGCDAASFEALAERGLALTTPAAFADMQVFTERFLEAYYMSIATTFHKYDKNHMLIGNRWQPGTANSEVLCRVAGKYLDVISINYYACAIDAAFIKRLYQWSGHKPQLWSEFYFTATKESNVAANNSDMATQRERGLAYRNYVEGAAALGFVVGIEWFTLLDQAVSGRFFEGINGERANTGLFNVADRPYRDLFAEMAKTHSAIYDVWLNGKPPYRLDSPRFNGAAGGATRSIAAGRPTGPMVIDGLLSGWPGRPPERIGAERLVIGRDSGGVEAAFKVCWDDTHLYLLANVTDPTPMKNEHSGEQLWNGDAIELFIGSEKIDQGGSWLFTDHQVLLGAGKNHQTHVVNAATQPVIGTSVTPAVDGKGYTLEAAIPWAALNVTPHAGQTLLFDLALGNSTDGTSRSSQLVWNGGARNSSDRSAWGRLTLVP